MQSSWCWKDLSVFMKMYCFQFLSSSLYDLKSKEQNADLIKGYDLKNDCKISEAQTIPDENSEWQEKKKTRKKLFSPRERGYFISDRV